MFKLVQILVVMAAFLGAVYFAVTGSTDMAILWMGVAILNSIYLSKED